MRIAILGTGYVGLSTGVCLAEIGHEVTCIDTNGQKIAMLQRAISPIYEPGLETLLLKNIEAGRLHFTTSHEKGLMSAEIIIMAVGTPPRVDGEVDLSYIEQAAMDIAEHLAPNAIVVVKSTVPVGTNETIKKIIEENCKERIKVQIISNPEFLKQGSAIYDMMHADRIIIGSDNREASEKIEQMYLPFHVPIMHTSIRSAELIKYASNAFLATKISYINEIANLCEALGADVEEVAKGMGKDKRIGEAFLQPGIGYGGSCFPKDAQALLHYANSHGINFSLLKETIAINDYQQELLVVKALKRFGELQGKKIAMLGLSFKPETDDMREAPSIKIARLLTDLGADVTAYDPAATFNARIILEDKIKFASSVNEAIFHADAVFIVTEWAEFKQLDIHELVKLMRQPIIFDGRNCMPLEGIKSCESIEYYPVGKVPFIRVR